MASKYIQASITPPKRVQILKADSAAGYWKPGQFGYAIAYSTHPGMHTLDKGETKGGELAYLVSKAKHGRGGALWFSANGLRFTGHQAPEERAHLRRKKLDPQEAKQLLLSDGIDFSQDFHALPSYEVQRLLEVAKLVGYRKSKNAPGSTARMFYQYMERTAPVTQHEGALTPAERRAYQDRARRRAAQRP